ncbi:hypothetical protein Trichorick_01144 [Candidatus Trichorickettsia mobilis]|uniref:G domain-containing protein n=1 Tax=Candidatus Trichorickettsia mobilis TaxID=1346319 RepID=A0ABZ0UTW2_9RICK|nr:hypothetical protein [Candidatus Trichorickettsia mobilis]WPY01236.1 hypothetical protein Trichorick_01144 [Candidatus Trichorickettsia mobilis]
MKINTDVEGSYRLLQSQKLGQRLRATNDKLVEFEKSNNKISAYILDIKGAKREVSVENLPKELTENKNPKVFSGYFGNAFAKILHSDDGVDRVSVHHKLIGGGGVKDEIKKGLEAMKRASRHEREEAINELVEEQEREGNLHTTPSEAKSYFRRMVDDVVYGNKTVAAVVGANDDVSDLEATLVCGDTGSGKSTLVNYLLGHILVAEHAENSNSLRIACEDQVANIGHDCVSETSVPGRYTGTGTYWDCPGFEDTGGSAANISNAFSIAKIGDKARAVKILAVVEEADIAAKRSTAFRSIISKMTAMFDNRPDLANSVVFCFTKAQQIKNYKAALVSIINSKDSLNAKEKQFLNNIIKKNNFVVFPCPNHLGRIDNSVRDQLLEKLNSASFVRDSAIAPVVSVKSLRPLNELLNYTNDQVSKTMSEIVTELMKCLI